MVQKFAEWLDGCRERLGSFADARINVVGLVGNECVECTMALLFKNFLADAIPCGGFSDKGDEDEISISVDAYYAPKTNCLYLLLNGMHSLSVQNGLFQSSKYANKNFFEKLSAVELKHIQFLHLLFVSCHLIVFVDQNSRFCTGLVKALSMVKSLKSKARNHIINVLSENDNISKRWSQEGRLASTKIVFVFSCSSLKPQLSVSKKVEILERSEKSLENQIVMLLKHQRIVDNFSPDTALASLPSVSIPFVHILRQFGDENEESCVSSFVEGVHYFMNSNEADLCNLLSGNATVERKSKHDKDECLCKFVRSSIGLIKSDKGKLTPVYYTPKMAEFLSGLEILFHVLIDRPTYDYSKVANKLNAELTSMENFANFALQRAVYAYEAELKKRSASMVISSSEHREIVTLVVQFLSKQINIEFYNKLVESLREKCTEIWRLRHERCEVVSLTGKMCILPVNHQMESEENSISRKRISRHTSGVKFVSTCNCGRKQANRHDPFTLKEANYDFYEHNDAFRCCATLERFEFPLFRPSEIRRSKTTSSSSHEAAAQSDGENDIQRKKRSTKQPRPPSRSAPTTNSGTEKHTDSSEANSDDDVEPLETEAEYSKCANDVPPEEEDQQFLPNPLEYNIRFFDDDESGGQAAVHQNQLPSGKVTILRKKQAMNDLLGDHGDGSDDEENSTSSDHSPHRRRIREGEEEEDSPSSSFSEEEEEDDVEEDDGGDKKEQLREIKSSSDDEVEAKPGDYLDNYDSHLTRRQKPTIDSDVMFNEKRTKTGEKTLRSSTDNILQFDRIAEKYKGKYLDHLPFYKSPDPPKLKPLFPSWSVLCVGASHMYSHPHGMRNSPNFKSGSEYLLPWMVNLTVNTEQWQKDMAFITANNPSTTSCIIGGEYSMSKLRNRRLENVVEGTNTEKVKLFVGFDYECRKGHRFMVKSPNKALRHDRKNGTLLIDADQVLGVDLPIWMPCTCSREPRQMAQLMRIHVVTPKAPVTVLVNPIIQLNDLDQTLTGFFYSGNESPISLTWAKYYVMRLPFIYIGPNLKPILPPKWPETAGKLLKNCITVVQSPIIN